MGDRMPFLLAFSCGVVLTPAARRVGLALGLVDRPWVPRRTDLKIHGQPISVLGGAAVTAAAFATVAIVGAPLSPWLWASVLAVLAIGLVDDLWPLPPWVRVVALALAGSALAVGGWRVPPVGPFSVAGVVLLVVACANAVNLIDGQDGLAGGLGALAAVGLAGISALGSEPSGSAVSLAFGGALVAFVVWNRPPARIFLGNGGDNPTGIVLASGAAAATAAGGVRGLLAAGACLLPFGFEMAFTTARRLLSGAPLMRGDRGHSYDLVSEVLGSRLRSTIAFWSVQAASVALGLIIASVPLEVGIPLASVLVVASLAAGVWMFERGKGAWISS
jgi:UDP-GlcNAc:undecaprenyl-phosphate GlcNAc-1-phosphate transferase